MNRPEPNQEVLDRARNIRLLICDVDGVLSDGKVILGSEGEEFKTFNIKDGLGIKALLQNGIQVAIITGRDSPIVDYRARELGITHVFQGRQDKVAALNQLRDLLGLDAQQIAHIGDDLPDLTLFPLVGLTATVADGHWLLRERAHWTSASKGGDGAVRELAELLLESQGHLQAFLERYRP